MVMYSDFLDGAVYIVNCTSVRLFGSSFINNTAIGNAIMFKEYDEELQLNITSGGGGLSIIWNDRGSPFQCLIDTCSFENNNASYAAVIGDPFIRAEDGMFKGRGGGLSILVLAYRDISLKVQNCWFVENSADVNGGGLYLLLLGTSKKQTYSIQKNTFIRNHAKDGGGGIHCAIDSNFKNRSIGSMDKDKTKSQLHFLHNCLKENTADFGGGIALEVTGDFHGRLLNTK